MFKSYIIFFKEYLGFIDYMYSTSQKYLATLKNLYFSP